MQAFKNINHAKFMSRLAGKDRHLTAVIAIGILGLTQYMASADANKLFSVSKRPPALQRSMNYW
jgi:hypothetical protein